MDCYCNVIKGNVHVWLGCTKMRNPRIGTVLHWRPPDERFLVPTHPYLFHKIYIFFVVLIK